MKLYVAGWNAYDARELADLLDERGHGNTIVSRWHGGRGKPTVLRRTSSLSLEERHAEALRDYEDIERADALIQMTGAVLRPKEELYDPRRDVRRFQPSEAEIKRVLNEVNCIQSALAAAQRAHAAAAKCLDQHNTKKNRKLFAAAVEKLAAAKRRRPDPAKVSAWVEGDHWWPTPECYTIGIPFLAKGCFVEFGYARALGKRLFVLGLREGLFHWERRVRVCYTFCELAAAIRTLRQPARAYREAHSVNAAKTQA